MIDDISNLVKLFFLYILNILEWVPVGWLSLIIALITLIINNHKKLLQRFQYKSEIDNSTTTISVYNDSIGTEAFKLNGIMVNSKKCWLYRKVLAVQLKYNCGHKHVKIFPYFYMLNKQNDEKVRQSDYMPLKSHNIRNIYINRNDFLKAVRNRLYDDYNALERFCRDKPIYIHFVYEKLSGKTKILTVKVVNNDSLGRDLDKKTCQQVYQAQRKEQSKGT